MPRHTEQRFLPYSPEQLFDLVADVGRYQEFLPWVAATRIRSNDESEMVADLVVGFGALKETFTSKVRKTRPDAIEIDYVEGPLKYLHNSWKFRAVPGGSEVDFHCAHRKAFARSITLFRHYRQRLPGNGENTPAIACRGSFADDCAEARDTVASCADVARP